MIFFKDKQEFADNFETYSGDKGFVSEYKSDLGYSLFFIYGEKKFIISDSLVIVNREVSSALSAIGKNQNKDSLLHFMQICDNMFSGVKEYEGGYVSDGLYKIGKAIIKGEGGKLSINSKEIFGVDSVNDFVINRIKVLSEAQDIKDIDGYVYDYYASKFVDIDTKLYTIGGKKYSDIPKGFVKVGGDYSKINKVYKCNVCGTINIKGLPNKCKCGNMGGYHGASAPFTKIADKSRYVVGLEIERDFILGCNDVIKLKSEGFKYESDGSVGGGEVISPPMGINEAIYKLRNMDYLYPVNEPSDRCGGHIHLSEKGVDKTTLYNKIKAYRPLLWSIFPTRAKNRYCSSNAPTNERYRDINLTSRYNTIEFRIFPGVWKYDDIKFRLSLIKFILANATENEREAGKIIKQKRKELEDIILIRYNKRVVKPIFDRIGKHYNITF